MTDARRRGRLLLLGATLAWSTAGLFARAIPLDTPTVILWRGLFGAAGLVGLLLVLQGPAGLRDFGRLGRAGWLYALCSGLGMLCFVGALKATTIAHVAIIYATVPFAAAGLGWLVLRERPGSGAMAAAIAALSGSVVMVGLGGDGRALGDLMAVGMVLAMAAIIVIARARPGLPVLAAGIVSAIWVPLVCLPFATLDGLTVWNVFLMAGFGLLNSTLGFALFIYGSRHCPPVETALIGALETPLTPLWVWLVFAEQPTAATLAGGGIVMLAVLGHLSRGGR
ncbi:DMT family transporter [Rhodobacter sp. Har01]|uniref:DMT family transporter n=1 Tax=Rhodobacter sp. Har01 TaxID=2883999 RepID=UPI001D06DEA9|nr:DMT family transporter [Rhodobacter sp. Har01]MCB6179197.1 DMT family transporter [Rhodobacter sp. Har01]